MITRYGEELLQSDWTIITSWMLRFKKLERSSSNLWTRAAFALIRLFQSTAWDVKIFRCPFRPMKNPSLWIKRLGEGWSRQSANMRRQMAWLSVAHKEHKSTDVWAHCRKAFFRYHHKTWAGCYSGTEMRCSLAVRTTGFPPGDPGSTPGSAKESFLPFSC